MIRKRRIINNTDDFIAEQNRIRKGKKIFLIQSGVFLACCLIIGWAWGGIFSFMKTIGTGIGEVVSQGTKTIVGQTLGKKPITDDHGNINVAVMGYGGENHAGGFLTDSMMIISINPEKGTMAMLSIPRDLWVKHPSGSYGRINSIFSAAFFQNKKDYDLAAQSILDKFTEITSIKIPYYAFIDFPGFEKFIDTLGGVKIDVQEPIYDTAYPGPNNSYVTFSIQTGEQILDGATALKYARSRHSTSDFSRSLRQQQIIQGIMDQVFSSKTLLSPSRVNDLYKNMTAFVHTNVQVDEMLWGLPYTSALKKKSSRQIAACGSSRRQTAQAGCLLYTPPMDAFGGASVQIPSGASPSNVSNYKAIQSFVADTILNNDFLAEGATIRVLNGISTGATRGNRLTPIANNVAVDFVEEGFTIFDVDNAPEALAESTLSTNGPGRKASIEKIRRYFPNVLVVEGPVVPDGPSLTLTIGDNYLSGSKVDTKTLPLYLQY